jgi:uncharacterized membrane protein
MGKETSCRVHRAGLLLAALVLLPAGALASDGATFQGIGHLVPTCVADFIVNDSFANGVSDDGRAVVGSARGGSPPGVGCGGNFTSVLWTAEGGMFDLDPSFDPGTDHARDVSAAGDAAVGNRAPGPSGPGVPYLWTQAGGTELLALLPGGDEGIAWAIASDGSLIAGYSSTAGGEEAVRWTSASAVSGLGFLPGGFSASRAFGLSSDGTTIVGRSQVGEVEPIPGLFRPLHEAFRWTAAGGLEGLGQLTSDPNASSEARAVSDDGNTVVGSGGNNPLAFVSEAFRWTSAGGMVGLGVLPGGTGSSTASGVSGDGSLVIGHSDLPQPQLGYLGNEAFLWDATHGMRTLWEVLESRHGFDLGPWDVKRVNAISPDGRFLVGYATNQLLGGFNSEGFIAFQPDPYLVVIDSFERGAVSLQTTAPGAPGAAEQTLVPLNPDHVLGGRRTIRLEANGPGSDASGQIVPSRERDALVVGSPSGGSQLALSYDPAQPTDLTNAGAQDRFVLDFPAQQPAVLARIRVVDDASGVSATSLLPTGLGRVDVGFAALVGAADLTAVRRVELELETAASGDYELAVFRTGRATACSDGLDNDGDGSTDFPADAGCADAGSEREGPNCDNGIDDDGDGLVDTADPGCGAASDPTEATWACSDGLDNDGNGRTDYPDDLGCGSPTDDVEDSVLFGCNNGVDDDGDGFYDFPDDPGCFAGWDTTETDPDSPCDDGIDNDLDLGTDYDPATAVDPSQGTGDPACFFVTAPTESPQCDDLADNDGDGRVDWDGGLFGHPPDPQCGQPWKNSEAKARCGLGFEAALLVAPLMLLLRRRRL